MADQLIMKSDYKKADHLYKELIRFLIEQKERVPDALYLKYVVQSDFAECRRAQKDWAKVIAHSIDQSSSGIRGNQKASACAGQSS